MNKRLFKWLKRHMYIFYIFFDLPHTMYVSPNCNLKHQRSINKTNSDSFYQSKCPELTLKKKNHPVGKHTLQGPLSLCSHTCPQNKISLCVYISMQNVQLWFVSLLMVCYNLQGTNSWAKEIQVLESCVFLMYWK